MVDLSCNEQCDPPSGEVCNNLIDDDLDTLVDCADPDCEGAPCDDGDPLNDPDSCRSGACRGDGNCVPDAGQEGAETSCSDGNDNDCDDLFDCDDPDCEGQTKPCGTCGLGTSTCQAGGTWSDCLGQGCEQDACGRCGTKTCQADCTWGDCQGEHGCQPSDERGCAKCGTETCGNDCAWGNCHGQGVCEAGTYSNGLCGCGRGVCNNDCSGWWCDCGWGGNRGCTDNTTSCISECPCGGNPCLMICSGSETCKYKSGGECTFQDCTGVCSASCTFVQCL